MYLQQRNTSQAAQPTARPQQQTGATSSTCEHQGHVENTTAQLSCNLMSQRDRAMYIVYLCHAAHLSHSIAEVLHVSREEHNIAPQALGVISGRKVEHLVLCSSRIALQPQKMCSPWVFAPPPVALSGGVDTIYLAVEPRCVWGTVRCARCVGHWTRA